MAEVKFGIAQRGDTPMVDWFENQSAEKATQRISLNEWLHNSESRDVVEKARSMSVDVFRKQFISQLPGITPSGTLQESMWPIWPPRPAYFTFNGFICIEVVDGDATTEDLDKLKTDLGQRFENLYYAGVSIIGNGLILIFRVFFIGHYGLGYMSVCDVLREELGLKLDVSHLNFRHRLPPIYDPNAYFNPLATDDFFISFRLGRWSNKGERSYEESQRITYQVAVLVDKIVQNKIQIFTDNRIGSQIGCSLAAEFGEYGRCFFNQIAGVSPCYDKRRSNKQYDGCVQFTAQSLGWDGKGRSSIGTFFHHCKEQGLEIPAFNKL